LSTGKNGKQKKVSNSKLSAGGERGGGGKNHWIGNFLSAFREIADQGEKRGKGVKQQKEVKPSLKGVGGGRERVRGKEGGGGNGHL